MGSQTKMNPVRLVLFWLLAQILVFEKSVSAARILREKFVKPELNTAIIGHIPTTLAVEIVEPQPKFAKGFRVGVVDEVMKVASENECQQSWLSRKSTKSNTRLLSSGADSSSAAGGHVEESDEQQTVIRVADEIDYSGPSTHPPPRGH